MHRKIGKTLGGISQKGFPDGSVVKLLLLLLSHFSRVQLWATP